MSDSQGFFDFLANSGSYRPGEGTDPFNTWTMVAPPQQQRSGSASSYYDRRRQTVNSDGVLNKVKYTYNDHSYYLAPKPGPDEDLEIKSMAFDDTLAEIRASTGVTWEEKTNALVSHYQMQSMKATAKAACVAVAETTSDRFSWRFRTVKNNNFVNIPVVVGAGIPNGATYVSFDVTIIPPDMLRSAVRPTTMTNVLVRLVEDPATPGNLHPNLTEDNIQDYPRMVLATRDTALPPLVGLRKSDDDLFNVEAWEKLLRNKLYECVFIVTASALRRAVVGDGAIRTVDQRLAELKQTRTVNGKRAYMSVQAYFERFQQINNKKGEDEQYGNITSTFFHNLDDQIKSYLTTTQNYLPPNAYQGSNVAEMNALLVLKSEA